MKISIGTKNKRWPLGRWQPVCNKSGEIILLGAKWVNLHLDDDDIDVILLTEPRKTSESSAFTILLMSQKVPTFCK